MGDGPSYDVSFLVPAGIPREFGGVPVLAPAGDGFHDLLFKFLYAITEFEMDFAIVNTKATDYEHDLER